MRRQGAGLLLAPRSRQALAEVLRSGEQAIILLNRRGFAGYVHCETCGHVLMCADCELSLTYHQGERRSALPPLRAGLSAAGGLSEVRRGAAHPGGAGHRAARRGTAPLVPGRPGVPHGLRRRAAAGRAAQAILRGVRRRAAGGPRGHADGGQGPRLPRRDPGDRGRRRRGPVRARLPGGRADLPAAHPGGGPRRARRAARPGAGADLQSRRALHPHGAGRRRGGVSTRRSWPAGSAWAIRRSRSSSAWSRRRRTREKAQAAGAASGGTAGPVSSRRASCTVPRRCPGCGGGSGGTCMVAARQGERARDYNRQGAGAARRAVPAPRRRPCWSTSIPYRSARPFEGR